MAASSHIYLETLDWTVQTILSQLTKGKIKVNLNTRTWEDPAQSLLIESMLLGLPLPQIVLAKVDAGSGDSYYFPVDGKQVLLTLVNFLGRDKQYPGESLRLTGLEQLPDLNGMVFKEFSGADFFGSLRGVMNTPFRVVCVCGWKSTAELDMIASRLNSHRA